MVGNAGKTAVLYWIVLVVHVQRGDKHHMTMTTAMSWSEHTQSHQYFTRNSHQNKAHIIFFCTIGLTAIFQPDKLQLMQIKNYHKK